MKRAYSEHQKFERRQEILFAAEDLFIKQGGKFPTVSAICLYSSMAKGTVYLYFKSKEEIYLALIGTYFADWLDSNKIYNKANTIDDVIELVLSFIRDNPFKFQLINQHHVLETKCTTEAVFNYQQGVFTRFDTFADAISKHLGEDRNKVVQWLIDIYYYLHGLWRTANPSEETKKVLLGTEMEVFLPEFYSNAKRVLKVLWQAH